jgi:hypothetical protein
MQFIFDTSTQYFSTNVRSLQILLISSCIIHIISKVFTSSAINALPLSDKSEIMRTPILIVVFVSLLLACRKEEFRENPSINHTVEAAVDANLGKYLASGKINNAQIDSIDLVISKVNASNISLSSSLFPALIIPVTSLTELDGYAESGGSGLNLISSTNGIQLTILNSNLLLKYENGADRIDIAGKKEK